MWRASRVVGSIFGGVFLAGMGAFFYTPLPSHLENWWNLQLFFAKFKINFIKSEFQYRMGSEPRLNHLRRNIGASLAVPLLQKDKDELKIYDREVDGVPVRVYQPRGAVGQLPGLVYLHGGGWSMFDIDMFDGICAHMAREAKMVVISVSYRLAPEHPFPAGFEDSLSVTKYVLKNAEEFSVNSRRVALGGDSGGGNLAAAVTLRLRDEKFTPALKAQLIIYGSLQFSHVTLPQHRIRENLGGKQIEFFSYLLGTYLGLNQNQMDLINKEKYLTPEIKAKSDKYIDVSLVPKDLLPKGYTEGNHVATTITDDVVSMNKFLDDRRLAPLLCEDLSKLPSSLVISVDWDTLRDENIMYAERMRKAGNDVTLMYLNNTWHGVFQRFDYDRYGYKAGAVLMDGVVDFLKKKVAGN